LLERGEEERGSTIIAYSDEVEHWFRAKILSARPAAWMARIVACSTFSRSTYKLKMDVGRMWVDWLSVLIRTSENPRICPTQHQWRRGEKYQCPFFTLKKN